MKLLTKLYVKILVLLIDAARRPYFKPKETKDLRQIAVNTLSRNLLDDIGAWENIESRAWPVHRMRIGESMGVGGIEGKGDILKVSELYLTSVFRDTIDRDFSRKMQNEINIFPYISNIDRSINAENFQNLRINLVPFNGIQLYVPLDFCLELDKVDSLLRTWV